VALEGWGLPSQSLGMADGCWEVDVPKKANSFCTRCANTIGTSELRFQWCPAAGGPKPYFHVLCAVKAGTKEYTRVSKASVRKSTGLTGAQRETLSSLLAAPGEAAAAALLKAAGYAQAPSAAAPPAKRSAAAPEEEPPAKRARTPVEQSVANIEVRPKAKAKAKAKAKVKAKAKAKAKPKAKAKAKAKASGRATAKAKLRAKLKLLVKPEPKAKAKAKSGAGAEATSGGAAPKGKAGMSAKDLAKFEEQKQVYGSWSNDKLKALLKLNDQSRSGNKAVLVAKVADGAAFGKLPRCPKCFGGKIKFRVPGLDGLLLSLFQVMGGGYGQDKEDDKGERQLKERKRYYCTGFFDDDEKMECDWQADTVKREAWESN